MTEPIPILSHLLVAALGVALIICMVTDYRTRKIYNKVNAGIALMAPLYWIALGEAVWPQMVIHVGMALAVFGVFAFCFRFGLMGGGDVKLIAALALWFGPTEISALILFTSILGLVVTFLFWIEHRQRRRIGPPRIPYGIAIALAGMWVIGQPYFNQFA